MLKTNSCPQDAPSEIHKEIERKRKEIERRMPSNKEAMDNFMKEHGARRWMPVKKRSGFANWFYRTLKIHRNPKAVNKIKNFLK